MTYGAAPVGSGGTTSMTGAEFVVFTLTGLSKLPLGAGLTVGLTPQLAVRSTEPVGCVAAK